VTLCRPAPHGRLDLASHRRHGRRRRHQRDRPVCPACRPPFWASV